MCIELSTSSQSHSTSAAHSHEPRGGSRKQRRKWSKRRAREAAASPPEPKRRKQRPRHPEPDEVAPAPKLPVFASNAAGLVQAFEDATLAREDFTHAAHLVVALAYAHGHRTAAYTRLREGIQRYNAATGLVETPTRGYHETITQAWFQLVLHFLDVYDHGQPLQSLADDLVVLFERDELFRHYSRERLLAAEARAGWVEPDLSPLPELEELTPADRRWLAGLAVSSQPLVAQPLVARGPVAQPPVAQPSFARGQRDWEPVGAA